MTPEKEHSLVTNYPSLFRGVYKHPTENLMFFGCECGDGWFRIIDAACRLIAARVKQTKADFSWFQIKEKYGTLRLYSSGHDDYIAGVIDIAESMSALTCDQCGNPGETSGTGWLSTRCERCRPEMTLT